MYQLTQSPGIVRRGDAFIPADPLNADYQQYLAWIAAGNTPEPYVAPPAPPPLVVSRFQAKAALADAGLLAAVETIMASPQTPEIAKLAWADAVEFRRTSPTVLSMGAALGLTESALDQLFAAAAQIEA
jgi:hypothetical protein